MDVVSAVTPLLRDIFTCIKSVIDNTVDMNDELFRTLTSLKTSLEHGEKVVDKALGYQVNDVDKNFKDKATSATISLIQLLYNAEDIILDKESPNVENRIGQCIQAILQCLGLSRNKPSTLQQKLSEILEEWQKIFEVWETNCDISGMEFHEKKCLAYFLLFPNGYRFNINDLVHLWIGEFEPNSKPPWESIVDKPNTGLLFEFNNSFQNRAKLFAAETCQHINQNRPILNDKTRHLSLSCDLDCSQLQIPKILKLRTFLLLYGDNRRDVAEILSKLRKSLSLLRVLSLRHTKVRNLQAWKLKFLRFLDISFTTVEQLSTNLHKSYPALQFLKIKGSSLYNLPLKEFQQLTDLRYVDWDVAYFRAQEVPRHIRSLIHLETLPLFQVGTEGGRFISELNGLNNLQGSIRIENLERVYVKPNDADRDVAEEAMRAAKEAMLHEKSGLRRIELHWNSDARRDSACDEHILKGLQPHKNVKELMIENYRGNDLPVWISESKIEKVNLVECGYCYLPALGKMRNLKTLVLENMRHIKEVNSDGDADTVGCFPELESMEFHNMTDLEEWKGVESRGVLPKLKELKFEGCTMIDSSLPFIRYLMESRPSMYISKDSECMRCDGDGTCSSSVACSSQGCNRGTVASNPTSG